MSKSEQMLKKSLTLLIREGLVPSAVLKTLGELAEQYALQIYLSTAQNLRILDVKAEDEEAIKKALLEVGAEFKGPGKFPSARVCVGLGYCTLGITDTFALSKIISEKFGARTDVKPKFKIAISGCPACCANSMNTDIGIKATKVGYDLYVGGKGGTSPRSGKRIAKGVGEAQLLEIIEKVVDFHESNTVKKQRFAKLIDLPDFPYPAV